MINYFNIPVEFMQLYLSITLMLKEYFVRCNTIHVMIVEHKTLSCKTKLLLIPQFCIILLCLFIYTLSSLVILQNYQSLYIYIYIYIYTCQFHELLTIWLR